MAYRFLLEVPAQFGNDANVAIASVNDAQVLVSRSSHGLGFDDPYVDMSVAAHSLAVIPVIYGWANDIGATRPDARFTLRIVLHDGRRVGLHEADAVSMAAAIRRDQPWVERNMPKIGDHEPNEITRSRWQRVVSRSGLAVSEAPDDVVQLPAVQSVILERTEAEFSWQRDDYALVAVTNIAAAEKFYYDVLGLNLVSRLKRDERGNWRELPVAYDHEMASYDNTEADRVLLEHGTLRLALARVGHGARLDYSKINTHVSLLVDADVLARLKATVLMRGFDVLEDEAHDFTFRDPYGVAWSATDHAANVDR